MTLTLTAADRAIAHSFSGSLQHTPARRSIDEVTEADLEHPPRTEEEGFRRYPLPLQAQAFMAAWRGWQHAARVCHTDPAAIMFRVDGCQYTRSSMLASNADDPEFCDWLASARPGDVFRDGAGCECIFDTENMVAKHLEAQPWSAALALQGGAA